MRTPPRMLIASALLLLPLTAAACGGGGSDGGSAPPAAGHVDVVDNRFKPEDIEVLPGDTVTWDFKGAVQHNVQGEGFKSKNMKDGAFEHTFNSAGEYEYVCTLHPGMKGKVVVG